MEGSGPKYRSLYRSMPPSLTRLRTSCPGNVGEGVTECENPDWRGRSMGLTCSSVVPRAVFERGIAQDPPLLPLPLPPPRSDRPRKVFPLQERTPMKWKTHVVAALTRSCLQADRSYQIVLHQFFCHCVAPGRTCTYGANA